MYIRSLLLMVSLLLSGCGYDISKDTAFEIRNSWRPMPFTDVKLSGPSLIEDNILTISSKKPHEIEFDPEFNVGLLLDPTIQLVVFLSKVKGLTSYPDSAPAYASYSMYTGIPDYEKFSCSVETGIVTCNKKKITDSNMVNSSEDSYLYLMVCGLDSFAKLDCVHSAMIEVKFSSE